MNMINQQDDLMDKIVSLSKRRGFVSPACEIYGGLAGSYSYGPYGITFKNNIKRLWWKKFIEDRDNMYGIDGPILLHPKLWVASGHIGGFNDAMVDCKKCKKRFRADHLIEDATGEDLEGDLVKMNEILKNGLKCPFCGASDWTEAKLLNMMFKTEMNGIDEPVYLRPETAGAIFVEFKNVVDVMRPKLPFGIGQIGKAFRNEIVVGNFIFRTREFEQMEIEYFFDPEAEWEPIFNDFLDRQEEFAHEIGIPADKLRRFEHPKEKLSHYSRKTVDLEFDSPFGGFKELCGLAHRGDFDLKKHSEFSNEKLEYFDAVNNRRFVPHVIEPSFGLDRAILVSLLSAYHEEKIGDDTRVVMKFPHKIAPVSIAIFPLLKNKPDLVSKAREIYDKLRSKYRCEFDDNGNVGKRYRRQDEIGTPYCITIDFDTLEDESVTVRDRDTMEQPRIKISDLDNFFSDKF